MSVTDDMLAFSRDMACIMASGPLSQHLEHTDAVTEPDGESVAGSLFTAQNLKASSERSAYG